MVTVSCNPCATCRFNDSKGFGSIAPDAGSNDLFAHFSEVRSNGFKSLQEEQKIGFVSGVGPKARWRPRLN
ncbi:cold-shock protein [Ralstonia sp. SET104]|uniref:cold-shock protein n=1 Tax=Ralstonia sp. SET104 TaxID=2448774 RepID=UPI0021AA388C|nr:cold shock domain-containing protein [Ralstonia sp. SET104]